MMSGRLTEERPAHDAGPGEVGILLGFLLQMLSDIVFLDKDGTDVPIVLVGRVAPELTRDESLDTGLHSNVDEPRLLR